MSELRKLSEITEIELNQGFMLIDEKKGAYTSSYRHFEKGK